ncbi:MAG TPA: M6 family metalloprotease domain-containing protein [Gemmatimonadales bacterium]|nr:M6 family metalloprotease domain-containing protein [Gemmatimonadales bacterium]
MRHAVLLLLLPLILGLWPGAAAAQAPDGVRRVVEPPGMDFHPNGAWRRRAAQVRQERQAMLRVGDIQGLNRSAEMVLRGPFAVQPYQVMGTAVTGGYTVPVIPMAYSDTPVNDTIEEFYDVLFGTTPPLGRPYTLKTYYKELSHNRVNLDGVVFTPFQHDQTAAWVTDGCKGVTIPGQTNCPRPNSQNRMGQMLIALLDAISTGSGGGTVWSQFDNDGPDGIPNSGDDDGFVDFVTFLQPQVGGECTNSSGIWSHRWVISVWNNGSPYVTQTPRRDAQGNPIPGQFLQVRDYTIQSQVGGATGCASGAILPVGTVAHETGHAFGLPDLYDTSNQTWGIGDWSLMSLGNQVTQLSPSSYDPWSLFGLGWATVDLLSTSRTVVTGPRVMSDTIFLARALAAPRQYVLVENRQAVGSDSAQMGPGVLARQKMPGLLLWYVDEQKISLDLLGNRVNSGLTHGVALLQADGLNQLRARQNRGDPGDPYPGSTNNTRFSLLSNPAARDYQGLALGFAFDEIAQLPNGAMTFRYTRRPPSLVTTTSATAQVRVDGTLYQRYEDIVAPGRALAIGVEQSQLVAGGRTRIEFMSWNNGGAREQTVISGAGAPDTLVASMIEWHRLLVQTSGAGSVSSNSPTFNPATGPFVFQGSKVTLTATAAPGMIFTLWTGDTVSTSPVLTLSMIRPYDLTATFTVAVPVTVAEARAAIMGTGTLSVEQREHLDLQGNRNGYFDIGDYLSMLSRLGLAPGIPAPVPMTASQTGGTP